MAQTRTNHVNLAPTELSPRPWPDEGRPSFDSLYRRYHPDLVRYAKRRGAEDPEGVADLALLDLARAFDRLRSTEAPVLRAYLYTAARNRTSRERASSTDDLHLEEIENLACEGFEEAVARGLDLDEMLSKLSSNQEEALRLRFFHQLTSAEAAAVMEIDAATVRTHQRRGLIRLRRLVLTMVVAVALVLGLVAVLRNTGTSTVRNDPIAPVEIPEDNGGPDQVEPAPGERSDREQTPAETSDGDRSGSDPAASSTSPSPGPPTTRSPVASTAPAPDSTAPTARTTSSSVIPVLPPLDTAAPLAQPSTQPSPSTSSSVPELPGVDDPLATVPELPAAPTTNLASESQTTSSSIVPELPAAPTTRSQSTSSSSVPELPAPDVPELPAPDVPELPAADDPSTDVPVLPGQEQPTSAPIPELPAPQ